MEIIQQIAVKAVEEIFESVKGTGLSDIGKTIKALTPVVSRTVLSILTAFLEKMDEDLVTGAKALRREDGITVKERNVSRTWLTELGELTYKRTYFRLRDGSFVYLLDHVIGVESYERISKELVADILQAATVKSYQQAIDSTKQEISRQTLHNRLVALDDLVIPVERVEETPETLDIFADEDHVHLQGSVHLGTGLVVAIDRSDLGIVEVLHAEGHVAGNGERSVILSEQRGFHVVGERIDIFLDSGEALFRGHFLGHIDRGNVGGLFGSLFHGSASQLFFFDRGRRFGLGSRFSCGGSAEGFRIGSQFSLDRLFGFGGRCLFGSRFFDRGGFTLRIFRSVQFLGFLGKQERGTKQHSNN